MRQITTYIIHSSIISYITTLSRHPHAELLWVPRLHENSPRPCELTHQSLSAANARNDATARYTLHDILGIPGYEMAVVDDVLFAFDKLSLVC